MAPEKPSKKADDDERRVVRHGDKGVYYAGEWLDIEDCDGKFTVDEAKCSGCDFTGPCPRSSSRNVGQQADKKDGIYDVLVGTFLKRKKNDTTSLLRHIVVSPSKKEQRGRCNLTKRLLLCFPSLLFPPLFLLLLLLLLTINLIKTVGAGCIGGCIVRELSRYKLSVLLVDAADDVSQGATKGNSGIVHAGYDDKPGSVRSKYCWSGNQTFVQLDRELRFGYQKNGSLVLAFNDAERRHLDDLKKRGERNGVKRLRIVDDRAELKELEPAINPDAIAALHSPDAGNVIPYEFHNRLVSFFFRFCERK